VPGWYGRPFIWRQRWWRTRTAEADGNRTRQRRGTPLSGLKPGSSENDWAGRLPALSFAQVIRDLTGSAGTGRDRSCTARVVPSCSHPGRRADCRRRSNADPVAPPSDPYLADVDTDPASSGYAPRPAQPLGVHPWTTNSSARMRITLRTAGWSTSADTESSQKSDSWGARSPKATS
jgi:hypothetical protein